MTTGSTPRATYRIQARSPGMGFNGISALARYLAQLGISHVYISPILTATPGSDQGYDVIDHEHLDPALGGDDAHQRMCETLGAEGLQQLLDIVPNYMAITRHNRLWWDVLENGPSSVYAGFFDVDWGGAADTRVLLPILAEHYFHALQEGTVKLVRRHIDFTVEYRQERLPAAPRSLGAILRAAAPTHAHLGYVADALEQLASPSALETEATLRRQRDKAVLFQQLDYILRDDPSLAQRIDASIDRLNRNVEALDAWLERQNWRLAHWSNAASELGYRRVLDLNTLAGLRVEDPRVFGPVHRLAMEWIDAGTIAGVRVDYVDGLRDPLQYLSRLRSAAPTAWILVDKTLTANEGVNEEWPVDGSTGYDFLGLCDQLFVDTAARAALTELEQRWTGESGSWEQRVLEAKSELLGTVLVSEHDRLTDRAQSALTRRIEFRDCTHGTIRDAIAAILVSYPVHRTYVREDSVSRRDREIIAEVCVRAAKLRPDVDSRVFPAFEQILALECRGELEREIALQVQQLTGVIASKAIEDTLYYRHERLLGLNELGGTPNVFGISVEQFHEALEHARYPRTLLASSTHRTHRGEDARSRLLALSEVPELWADFSERWLRKARRHTSELVDSATQYFFLQTWVAAHPLTTERAVVYMRNVVRNAKRSSSWTKPDTDYEAALERFLRVVMSDRELTYDVMRFVARIAPGAYLTSLARTLLKLTAPGVPDIYQGCELWDFSLGPDDNTSPVDYALRQQLLALLAAISPEDVLKDMKRGSPKLWLIWKVLGIRRAKPELFAEPYHRLQVEGPDMRHVVAFSRGESLVVLVPRLNADGEPKTRRAIVDLPNGNFRDVLSGATYIGSVPISALWAHFPVALLLKES